MKNVIKHKVHILFLSMALLCLVYGFFRVDYSFDVNVHDTYYVLNYFWLAKAECIYFIVLGLIYWALIKEGCKFYFSLICIHLFGSFLSFLMIKILCDLCFINVDYSNGLYYESLIDINDILSIGLIVFVLVQLLLFLNIFLSFFRKIGD